MNRNSPEILVVEDEDIIAGFIEYTLTEQRMIVTRVASAEAAWKELNRPGATFSAILLDRQLPDEDGISLLRRIKEQPSLRDIPVVMETAENDPSSIREGLAAGAYYYLTKPLESGVLWSVVDAAIAQHREYLELQAAVRDGARALACLQNGTFRYRTLTDAREIAQGLARSCPEPERAVIGLQELLVNAVEHGNLSIGYKAKTKLLQQGTWAAEIEKRLAEPAYRDRFVTVTFERTPKAISMTITDQGAGFDPGSYLQFDAERALDPHGRGIAMARLMSFDALEFSGNGNTVVARIVIPETGGPTGYGTGLPK